MSVAKYTNGEQNKEMTKVRQHCDMKYTHTLLLTLSAHLSGTSGRESMRMAMLTCSMRNRSGRRRWTQPRVIESLSSLTIATTRRLLFNQSHNCELMESRFKSTHIFSSIFPIPFARVASVDSNLRSPQNGH